MRELGYVFTALLLAVPMAAWKAFIGAQLWKWFVTPVFGMQPPSLWLMAGLFMAVSMSTHQAHPDKRDAKEAFWFALFYGVAYPPMVWLVAAPIALLAETF